MPAATVRGTASHQCCRCLSRTAGPSSALEQPPAQCVRRPLAPHPRSTAHRGILGRVRRDATWTPRAPRAPGPSRDTPSSRCLTRPADTSAPPARSAPSPPMSSPLLAGLMPRPGGRLVVSTAAQARCFQVSGRCGSRKRHWLERQPAIRVGGQPLDVVVGPSRSRTWLRQMTPSWRRCTRPVGLPHGRTVPTCGASRAAAVGCGTGAARRCPRTWAGLTASVNRQCWPTRSWPKEWCGCSSASSNPAAS